MGQVQSIAHGVQGVASPRAAYSHSPGATSAAHSGVARLLNGRLLVNWKSSFYHPRSRRG